MVELPGCIIEVDAFSAFEVAKFAMVLMVFLPLPLPLPLTCKHCAASFQSYLASEISAGGVVCSPLMPGLTACFPSSSPRPLTCS